MGVRFKWLLGTLTFAAASAVFIGDAIAQEEEDTPRRVEVVSVDQAFEDAFFDRTGTFFENRRPIRNLTWFLGPFPENDIASDAEDVHEVYENALAQQTQSDPYLRTADLSNPYNTSILLLPEPIRQAQFDSADEPPFIPTFEPPPAAVEPLPAPPPAPAALW
jgi:hypothetical protein